MNTDRDTPVTRRFVAVTLGELSAWHASGETRLMRSRFVDVPVAASGCGEPVRDGDVVGMLLRRLPSLAIDDEEGVLIARLLPGALADACDDSQLAVVPIDRLDVLVPLTARAKAILDERLVGYGLVLQQPWFQDAYRKVSYRRRADASMRAARALVSIFCGDTAWQFAPGLQHAAERALAQKDFDDASLAVDGAGSGSTTWAAIAFGWTRREPGARDALADLYDAGSVLRQLGDQLGNAAFADALAQLRGCAKSLRTQLGEGDVRLSRVLRSAEFEVASAALRTSAPDAFPAVLGALVLYLRWQERFHAAGSVLDVAGLSKDIRELSHVASADAVVPALWLLGFYAGSDRTMPLWYATQGSTLPWFHGHTVSVDRFEPVSLTRTAPVDNAVSSGSAPSDAAIVADTGATTLAAATGIEPVNPPSPAEPGPANATLEEGAPCVPPETVHTGAAEGPGGASAGVGEQGADGIHAVCNGEPLVPPAAATDPATEVPLAQGETGSLLPGDADGAGGQQDSGGGEARVLGGSRRKRSGGGASRSTSARKSRTKQGKTKSS